MTDSERYFEVSMVAKRLKMCPETIRRYIRSGQLQAIQLRAGGPFRIPESALDAFLRATRVNTLRQSAS